MAEAAKILVVDDNASNVKALTARLNYTQGTRRPCALN